MRSSIILSVLLALTSLVLAAAQTNSSSTGNSGNVTCGENCHTIIDKDCAKNDTLCTCNPDYNIQIRYMKCLYDDCLPVDLATVGYGSYASGCQQAAASKTSTSTSAVAIPTGAVAKEFTVPPCAMECLSSFDTVPRCDGKKGDPACVCGILEGTSTQDRDEAGKVIKCFVDQCGLTDAAVAITTFTVDCGAKIKDIPADQLPFPFNGLVLAKRQGAAESNRISILAIAIATFLGVSLL